MSIAYTKPDNTPIETVTYTYDAGGQRTVKSLGVAALPETPFTATYDEANRLSTITLAGETFTLGYDNNGNLASKSGPTSGTTTYSWNARNQLAAISGPAGNASFKYDALGRRIEKTVNGNATGFLYDGSQAIAELRGNALDTVYHTGLAIDEVLARYGASGNKTLLTDALTSVISQANDDQSIANFYAYSPYGEAQTLGPDGGNSLQYTGRENDGTGLYYYRARYYDPVLKRFISEDPIGAAGGVNLYAYVRANPARFVDPLGRDAIVIVQGWNVNIILPITVGGPGNTPARTQTISGSISSAWTGEFGSYNVTTTVVQGSVNGITNYVNVPRNSDAGQVVGSNTATIGDRLGPRDIAHEGGHLMGLPNRFDEDAEGYPHPRVPSDERSIMGPDTTMPPTARDITDIIRNDDGTNIVITLPCS